jgi:predicted RNA binding protein YcfA (HicA-like mRNA interferase family)
VKIPRDLSGSELVKMLSKNWGCVKVNQEGSHIILQTETPSRQRISVPDHNPVRVGTLNSILRMVSRHKNVDKGRHPKKLPLRVSVAEELPRNAKIAAGIQT